MSKRRPTLRSTKRVPDLKGTSALFAIYGAVDSAPGLIHGKLDGNRVGEHCAIGHYFADHPTGVLETALIDEVATVNDSVPHYSPKERRVFVLRWLRWKLAKAGLAVGRGRRVLHEPTK